MGEVQRTWIFHTRASMAVGKRPRENGASQRLAVNLHSICPFRIKEMVVKKPGRSRQCSGAGHAHGSLCRSEMFRHVCHRSFWRHDETFSALDRWRAAGCRGGPGHCSQQIDTAFVIRQIADATALSTGKPLVFETAPQISFFPPGVRFGQARWGQPEMGDSLVFFGQERHMADLS